MQRSRIFLIAVGVSISLLSPRAGAEDLTSPQHELQFLRISTAPITGSGGTVSLPFSVTPVTSVGERYTGTVELVFPATINGNVDATGNFLSLNPPVKATAKLKFQYQTRTSDPQSTTYPYALNGTLSDNAFPRVRSCDGPQIIQSVSAGAHQIEYTLECTWDRIPYDRASPRSRVFATYMDFVTAPPGMSGGFTFFVYTSYQSGTTDLAVSAIDPNCATATNCDGEYLEEDPATSFRTVRLVENLGSLKAANVTRSAIATDGVTMLMLRASVPETAPADTKITFNLENPSGATADSKWGVLMNRDGSGAGSSVTAPAEHVADGKRYAFALYRAPLDHPATDALNSTSVTIEAASTAKPDEKVDTSVRLVPPPIILVHGVWSERSAWAQLEPVLKSAGFRVCPDCRPDYGTHDPAPNFDPLERFSPESQYVLDVVLGAIRGALREDRGNGIAVTQVDGIGHSMGGIVMRARVATAMTGNDREYLRSDNYLKGDFHKIITVGSPHWGSTLVNWLIDHACDTLNLLVRNFSVADYMARLGKPIKGGVFGFQTHSIPLINLGRTQVPGHAIIAIAPPDSETERALRVLVNVNATRGTDTGDAWNFDLIGGGEGHHDTIVNDYSEGGGLAHPDTHTILQGIVHADITGRADVGETESPAVWNRIQELLRDPVDKSFSFFQALVPNPGDPIRGECTQQSRTPEIESAAEVGAAVTATITPAPGTVVRPGDTVSVTLTAAGATPVEGAIFFAKNQADVVTGTGPFSYSWVVPGGRAGRIDLLFATYGAAAENYGAETFVVVQPAQAPVSISATPSLVDLTRKDQVAQLIVTGSYPDGSEMNLTSSTAGTTYRTASGGSSVVSVTPEGLIAVKGNGTDTVIATHDGKTFPVPVTVRFQIRRRAVGR